MIVILILSFAAAGVLSYSLTTYRNSRRQILMDQAKVIADSEMENLYFQWNELIRRKTPIASVPNTTPLGGASGLLATTNTYPFLTTLNGSGWNIYRSLVWDQIPGTPDGSATGIMPGTVNQLGKNFYFTAKTSATIASPLFGTITYHSGRHFQYTSTSLFQFAVFYQGNLEMAPGSNMTIEGPIATNASAYLGTLPGITLTLASSVYYFQNYNGAADPLTGETDALTGTGYDDPIYNPNPVGAPPAQAAERALQVSKLSSQANFVGDVNVTNDLAAGSPYLAAYTNQLTSQVDANEIYRAVIAPPPVDSVTQAPLTEDPLVKASRMYNAAGVLITVEQTSAGSAPTIHIGGLQSDGSISTTAYDADFTGATALHTGATTAAGNTATDIISGVVRNPIVDPREELNGKTAVNLTTIDIANLSTALTTAMAGDSNLAANYNGVVYVYDKTDNTVVGASTTLNGVRIINATATPTYNDPSGNPLGFTVVSDNGVYVQGDYNTAQITVGGVQQSNPSGIMGDAVTALSEGWNPANSGLPIANRQATPSTQGLAGNHAPGMEIDAAILTGNTPTNTTVSPVIKSGGAQNLVRLMEDWYTPTTTPAGGLQLTVNGSMGQLFSSKYFQGPWVGTGTMPGIGNDRVYYQPHARNFTYDLHFQSHTPAGSPVVTKFHKGDFFFW